MSTTSFRGLAAASALGLVAFFGTSCSLDEGSVADRSTDESTAASQPDSVQGDHATEQADDAELSSEPAKPAEDAESADESSGNAGPATFADAVAYEDGLKVEVAGTEAATASEFAIGAEATDGEYTRFDVRVTNDSNVQFDAVLVFTTATYGEAGIQAEQVFDDTVGGGFSGVVPAGQSQTATFGFAIPAEELGNVTLQIELNTFEHEPAIFTGAIG